MIQTEPKPGNSHAGAWCIEGPCGALEEGQRIIVYDREDGSKAKALADKIDDLLSSGKLS